MSHHDDHHPHSLKEKKKKQREKNKRDWILFRAFEELRENVDIKAPERPAIPEKAKTPEDAPWSAKLTSIRNRLDNSRRTSSDRWNRFAGTSGGGGRGR